MRLKMRRNRMRAHHPLAISAAAAALLMGCGGSSDAALPQLSAATPATLQSCATLASSLALPDTRIDGLSGNLGMSPSQRIERQMPWAKFVSGQIERLPDTPR